MNPEELAELKELIEFLKSSEIGEFDLERGDLKIRLKFASALQAAQLAQFAQMAPPPAFPQAAVAHAHPGGALPVSPSASAESPATPVDEEAGLHIVKSPIVGTFYESPSPGSAAFVKAGDSIENGQVLCIVEAMKLMNEIESDVSGEIVKRLVTNGQPVEYGQKLFAVRPR